MDADMDDATDCADPDCSAAPNCGLLVINEVDYDQPMSDDNEFVEIYNAGATTTDLTGVQVLLANAGVTPAVVYRTVSLSGALAPDSYVVVASGTVSVPVGVPVVPFPGSSNNIQNASTPTGPPGDAVGLFDTNSGIMLDVFSYEGPVTGVTVSGNSYSFIEGNLVPGGDLDTAPGSFSRNPNGSDTDNNATDFSFTPTPTPGAPTMLSEICNNMQDDDADNNVDCADSDCVGSPACVEDCDDGTDNNANSLVDCQEGSCNTLPCDALGRFCTNQTCTCPSGPTETLCGNFQDDDCDGSVDCADSNCTATPACMTLNISGVDYSVIALGGKLVITGTGFSGSSNVSIGGTTQPFTVDSDTQITIAKVSDATPIGLAQPLVVTNGTPSVPFSVTAIRLQISELDCDQIVGDAAEFIEISTGVPGVSLNNYRLVFFNGSNDAPYFEINLNATTDLNGLLLVGNSGVVPAPALNFNVNSLQNGQDAVGVYQLTAPFGLTNPPTATALIDAVVYDTADADDPQLLAVLLGAGPEAVQVDEGANPLSESQSIQRCSDGRLDGRLLKGFGPPTPGAANGVCP